MSIIVIGSDDNDEQKISFPKLVYSTRFPILNDKIAIINSLLETTSCTVKNQDLIDAVLIVSSTLKKQNESEVPVSDDYIDDFNEIRIRRNKKRVLKPINESIDEKITKLMLSMHHTLGHASSTMYDAYRLPFIYSYVQQSTQSVITSMIDSANAQSINSSITNKVIYSLNKYAHKLILLYDIFVTDNYLNMLIDNIESHSFIDVDKYKYFTFSYNTICKY